MKTTTNAVLWILERYDSTEGTRGCDATFYGCRVCGASVMASHLELHYNWHELNRKANDTDI